MEVERFQLGGLVMSGASYREYIIASLLHDIGKLIRRAKLCRGEAAKSHTEHSVEYVDKISDVLKRQGIDVDLVKSLIKEHHSPTGGISIYDKAAASERTQGDEESRSTLCMSGRRENEIPMVVKIGDERRYVVPCPLLVDGRVVEPSVDVPSPRDVCECYIKSYELLKNLTERLGEVKIDRFIKLVEVLVNILKVTTSFVPAAVYGVKEPDTSLYVHLKLTAALASTGGSFRLLGIDVGKIQSYLHKSKTTDGAMAILRGRSLKLSLLQKVAVLKVIEEINNCIGKDVVTTANVLLDTGGEVIMIVPDVCGDLNGVLRKLSERSLNESLGGFKLYFAVTKPRRLSDLIGQPAGWRKLFEELEAELGREKLVFHRLDFNDGVAGDTCSFCDMPLDVKTRPLALSDVCMTRGLCKNCCEEFEVGKAARQLQMVSIGKLGPAGLQKIDKYTVASFKFFDYDVYVFGGVERPPPLGLFDYYINVIDFLRAVGVFIANTYLPIDEEGNYKSVEETGVAVYVKTDGNKMGVLKDKARASPSQLATFGLAVNTAYELFPNVVAQKYQDDVFVAYAGGDDALFVGTYRLLKYVGEVVEYVEKWGFKTAVGVYITDPKSPLYYTLSEVSKRLDAAKIDRDRSLATVALEPTSIVLDAKKLGELVDRVEKTLGSGLADVDYSTYIYRVGSILVEILKILEMQQVGDAKRQIVKKIVELAYMWNRRREEANTYLCNVVSGVDNCSLEPAALVELFRNCLKGGSCENVKETLGEWAFSIYLHRVVEKTLHKRRNSQ
ncbi:MAG: type III-A CRISPR-associated protein Cas10/Csm1 [Pyrobaculum sp.]